MLHPDMLPSPDHTYNHWWDIDYWDTYSPYGGSMPPYMNGEFIAQADTFVGLTEGSDFFNLIWYLPLNVAYGTSSTNCVWFQFAVRFVDPNPGSNGETVPSNMPDPVTWQIWDIKGPGGSDSDFHYTTIGLPYTVGHHYSWSLTNSTGPTITFDIKDLTASTEWALSSWHWTIPSGNMLADESMFSPSSAIEGYTEPSTTSLSGTPFFQSRVGTGITVDRYSIDPNAPSGIGIYRIEIGDYQIWNWMMLGPGSLPAPAMTSVSYPSIVHVGDTVTVTVNATNTGGTSQHQTMAVSFSVLEPVTNVAIVSSDLTSSSIYTTGYIAEAHYELTTVALSTYLVEGYESNWLNGENHYLKISFKPNVGSNHFVFYVKTVAWARDWATNWDPTSGTKDQQGEYVNTYQLIVDSIPPITVLSVGDPHYVSPSPVHKYVNSSAALALSASDNPGGSGVAMSAYRIYNGSYNTGWLPYAGPFYLTGLVDGSYSIAYNSTDNAGNVETTNTATLVLDNTPPTTSLAIGNPSYTDSGGNVYVASWTLFTLSATDGGSGVAQTSYRVRNATYSSGWLAYSAPFSLTGLAKSTYSIDYNSTDNLGNAETTHTNVVILNSKATMTGYSKNEILSLKALVNGAAIPQMLKNYLLYNLLTFAVSENDLALNYILLGNAGPANGALTGSRRTMQGFISWIMNSRNFGLIPPATANNWIATAQTIVNDITTAINMPI